MPLYVNQNGNWNELSDSEIPYIKSGLLWKTPVSVWGKHNNIWKQVWPSTPDGGPIVPPAPPPDTITIDDMSLYTLGEYYQGNNFLSRTAIAKYKLASNREIVIFDDGGTNTPGYWLSETGTPSNYEVRATGTASGTKNVWLSLDTNPEWTLSQAAVGASTAYIELSIRTKIGQVLMDTARIDFTVEVIDITDELPGPGA